MNGGNLRKFQQNFGSKQEYHKYLEKGKWRAGPSLNRADYNKIKSHLAPNVRRNVSIEYLHPTIATLNVGQKNWLVNANKLNGLMNKYGVTRQQLYRMFLHNHAHYLQKRTGLSAADKIKIAKRVAQMARNISNMRKNYFTRANNDTWNYNSVPRGVNSVIRIQPKYINNVPKEKIIKTPGNAPTNGNYMRANNYANLAGNPMYFTKSGNKWHPRPIYTNSAVVRLTPNHIKRFPFLLEKLIKTPTGLPNGKYIRGSNFPSNLRGRDPRKLQNQIQKTERFARAMQTVRPKLLNLGAKVAERARKLTGFKNLAEEYHKHFLTNTGNLMTVAKKNTGGASGSGLRKRKYTTANAEMMKEIFGNNALYARNNNDPMKRKTVRPNSPNTAARKNANAELNRKLQNVRDRRAFLRRQNEEQRLARAPPPGVTWSRNKNGTVSLVNLNKRRENLEKYLKLYDNFSTLNHNETDNHIFNKIGDNASLLVEQLKLGTRDARRYPFHRNTVINARDELLRILGYKLARLQEKKNKTK